jgi:hypothetical protein
MADPDVKEQEMKPLSWTLLVAAASTGYTEEERA